MDPGQPSAYLRSDISATLFLTEPQDYDIGVLTIRDTFGLHGIKLKAGSMVVYPSSSLHSVSPVLLGGQNIMLYVYSKHGARRWPAAHPVQHAHAHGHGFAVPQGRTRRNPGHCYPDQYVSKPPALLG